MTSKIRIKIGDVEVDYEGSEEFLREELPELLSAVLSLHRQRVDTNPSNGESPGVPGNGTSSGTQPLSGLGTINTISAKLRPNSGPDLAIAAAASISLGLGQNSFTRKDLLAEMKKATNYYKQTYSNNLGAAIKTLLTQDKIREVSSGKYSLSASERQRLEAALVN